MPQSEESRILLLKSEQSLSFLICDATHYPAKRLSLLS